ncbi:Pycsar system effector family protein [Streptomyces sp. NPDC053474]|uniref:Pycsar system effector family protein n=1 Tax=Streptomyces sp. NPDC053474 TaxID=3365704 RepID=UPI0037D9208A
MTTTPPRLPAVPQERTDAALATLRSELARSDSKAALLLALTGAAILGTISAAATTDSLPLAARIIGTLALAALLAATVLLLLAVRPVFGAIDWTSWHRLPLPELHTRLAQGQQPAEVKALAAAPHTKFTRLQRAIDCILAALTLLALAALLTASL